MADDEPAVATTIDTQLRAIAAIGEPNLQAGTRVGRYEILRQLGSGGMGVVYEARDDELARSVALKIVRPHAVTLADAQRRLRREARTMAKLPPGSCVVVHEIGNYDGLLYIAMELMPGGTLRAWMARRRRSHEVIRRFLAVGRGLAAAHAAGIVHRDFKPENVLLGTHDDVRIADFGLARAMGSFSAASDPGADQVSLVDLAAGTPAYMAPEQWTRGEITQATDQFAFCIALWEGLTGRRPFDGTTVGELKASVLRGVDAVALKQVPRRVREVLRRGLAVVPALRWPSMQALLARLEHRRGRVVAAAGAVAIGVALAIAWLALR